MTNTKADLVAQHRVATTAEALEVLLSRHNDKFSPAERNEVKQAIEALTAQAAQQSREPENNWLMQPALDWLENAEHGGEKERCKMIAAMLRDLWRKAQSTTPTAAKEAGK